MKDAIVKLEVDEVGIGVDGFDVKEQQGYDEYQNNMNGYQYPDSFDGSDGGDAISRAELEYSR
jgi:hypothetical protein